MFGAEWRLLQLVVLPWVALACRRLGGAGGHHLRVCGKDNGGKSGRNLFQATALSASHLIIAILKIDGYGQVRLIQV